MGLASVVGGECSGWAAEQHVEVDTECEREESLSDPGDESGQRFREVCFQPHLAFEGGEHRLDHEPDPRFCLFALGSLGEFVFGGGDQLDVDQLHRREVLLAPEPAVRKKDRAWLSRGELKHTVAFLPGFGADEVIADRDALAVTDKHEAHPPHEQAFRRAVPETGMPRELTLLRAA